MTTIAEDAAQAFRDAVATGNLTPNRPNKADIRALFQKVDNQILAASLTGGNNTTVLSGGTAQYGTFNDLNSANTGGLLNGGIGVFFTLGYLTPGDKGAGIYIDMGATNPNLPLGGVVHDTTNGRYLMLVPGSSGIILPDQFGARAMYGTNTNGSPNPFTDVTTYDSTDGIYAALNYNAFNPLGPANIQFNAGTYYTTRSIDIRGPTCTIRGVGGGTVGGSSTFIRPASNISGFVVQHDRWSIMDVGVIYNNNWTYTSGTIVFRSGEIYISTSNGTSAASGGPTGHGSGITDGTVTWNWVRSMTRLELDPRAFSGAIEDMGFYSHWVRTTDAYRKSFGLLGRSRATFNRCFGGNFSAHGISFIANGDFDFPEMAGNVNGGQIYDCAAYYNGMDGFHVSYSDGNACMISGCDAAQNGRWDFGLFDFLGTSLTGCESAYGGIKSFGVSQFDNGVMYNGYYWKARLPNYGSESGPFDYTQTPGTGEGTSAAHWILVGGDGTGTANSDFPAFSSLNTYEPGGSVANPNGNSATAITYLYIEGSSSTAQLGSRTYLAGGPSSGIIMPTNGTVNYLGTWYNQTQCSRIESATHGPAHTYEFKSWLGPSGGNINNAFNRDVLGWSDYTYTGGFSPRNTFNMKGVSSNVDGVSNLDYKLLWNNSLVVWNITGNDTQQTFGRSAPVGPGWLWFPNLVIGDTFAQFKITSGSAAPTTGNWARGDYCRNINQTVGQPRGWSCTVAGTPGTWVSDGNL